MKTSQLRQWKSFLRQSTRMANKPLKSIWTVKRNRLDRWNTETAVHDKVYDYYKWVCILTDQFVMNPTPSCYPHLLSKWMFEKFRLYQNNIVLVANAELHETIDIIINKLKNTIWIKELERMIYIWEDITPLIVNEYRKMKKS